MSRRNLIRKYQVITDAESSGTVESEVTDISGVDEVVYQIFLDGTVSSVADILVCNDDRIDASSVFSSLNFNTSLVLDGNVDQVGFIEIINAGYKWIKMIAYPNGGSGNINVFITGLSRGA